MWFSRRALGLHVLIIVVVPTFIGLCIWQVHRALGGNELSWAYVFEWPFFAGYAIYMWWRFVHEPPREAPSPRASTPGALRGTDGDDEYEGDTVLDEAERAERTAYNNYLAELAARDTRKQWR